MVTTLQSSAAEATARTGRPCRLVRGTSVSGTREQWSWGLLLPPRHVLVLCPHRASITGKRQQKSFRLPLPQCTSTTSSLQKGCGRPPPHPGQATVTSDLGNERGYVFSRKTPPVVFSTNDRRTSNERTCSCHLGLRRTLLKLRKCSLCSRGVRVLLVD